MKKSKVFAYFNMYLMHIELRSKTEPSTHGKEYCSGRNHLNIVTDIWSIIIKSRVLLFKKLFDAFQQFKIFLSEQISTYLTIRWILINPRYSGLARHSYFQITQLRPKLKSIKENEHNFKVNTQTWGWVMTKGKLLTVRRDTFTFTTG